MVEIRVLYFARLRAERGAAEEVVTTASTTPEELYHELAERHPLSLSLDSLRIAVNQRFATKETPLQEGDTVAFVPPVSGG